MIELPLVRKIVALAIEEDLAAGDVTSELSIGAKKQGRGVVVAKEPLVVCGLPLIEVILHEISPRGDWDVKCEFEDGDKVSKGKALATIRGSLRTILAAERTVLNFMQRLSGIATGTAKICAQARGLKVLDTRKTTPGLRVLEKYAARIGGAKNHRMHLGDMILVKNNHIDANGGSVTKTLERIAERKAPYLPLEVEVRSLEELSLALPFKPDFVMLDNMNASNIKRSLALIKKMGSSCMVEVSGGITVSRFPQLRSLGVTVVSMGSLTTQAQNVDISMRVE